MRILHVVEPLAGGMVTFIKSLVANMPSDSHLIIHGERKLVMPFTEAKRQLEYPNVKFFRWKSVQRKLSFLNDTAAAMELFSILKRLKKGQVFDVIHLHSSKGGFIGRIVCRMLGLQDMVVYTPNGAPFLGGANKVANYFYKLLEKTGSLFGGKVVCCSPSEKTAYESVGIDAIVINNGTSNGRVHNVYKQERRKTFKIATAGRIVDQKNPALFNEIANYFQDFNQFEFIWIGDGTHRHLLTSKNIKVTGWMDTDAAIHLLEDADLYISTANFEGLPFAVLEALALKKPLLLTNCIGNKDLISDGLNGSIFNNKNEAINNILHFYNNLSMLTVMGQHSKDHCTNSFDQQDTFFNYNKLYQHTSFVNRNKSSDLKLFTNGN